MKKTMAVLLSVIFIFALFPVSAAGGNEADIISLLGELKIMRGDPDGNFRPGDAVTRAECAKVAVAASEFRDFVADFGSVSPFADVSAAHWAAPYIRLAVGRGLVRGYTDGAFRPEGQILYEEAVSIFLKLLGYADEDFEGLWPYAQMNAAAAIGLSDNIEKGAGEALSRRDIARLVYNLLNARAKGGGARYIEKLGYIITKDVILIATANEDAAVGSGRIYTTAGTYKMGAAFEPYDIGRRGDIILNAASELIGFIPDEQILTRYKVTDIIGADLVLDNRVLPIDGGLRTYYKTGALTYESAPEKAQKGDAFITFAGADGALDYALLIPPTAPDGGFDAPARYAVYQVLEGAVAAYRDGEFIRIDIKDTEAAYANGVKTTFGAMKASLSMGDILYIKREIGGAIDYISYEKGSMAGPYTVSASGWADSFEINERTKIMRGGSEAARADIEINDIVYHSPELNMILAYSNKVFGIYEKALPNKDAPSSVVISGVTYKIEGFDAFNKLSSAGGINYGDSVTLLLGKTNDIADVLGGGAEKTTVYGYLSGAGKEEYTRGDGAKQVSYYIELVRPGGEAVKYAADTSYESLKNRVVRVSFSGGAGKAARANDSVPITGTFDWGGKKIGGRPLAADIKILDVLEARGQEGGGFTPVFPQRLDGVSFASGSVLYYEENERGEIKSLILNDVTGDLYSYGIVINAQRNTAGMYLAGVYTYDIGGSERSLVTSDIVYNVSGGQPAAFLLGGAGAVESIKGLRIIDEPISKVGDSFVAAGGKNYPLSGGVVVYKKDFNGNYTIIPLRDIVDNDSYRLLAYYDKTPEVGGRVRVIVASEKR